MAILVRRAEAKVPNMRSAELIQALRVVVREGEGTDEDVAREVVYYYSLSGELLAKNDPCEGEN